MPNVSRTEPAVHSPLPRSMPPRSPDTRTVSWVGQKLCGRKCSSWSLNQYQPPATGVDMATVSREMMAFCAAVLVTSWSNVSTIGWPTPAVMPSDGKADASTVTDGVTVVNVDDRWTETPLPVTETVIVYLVEGRREPEETHWPVVGEALPDKGAPDALNTLTAVKVPEPAATVTWLSSGTPVAPEA